MGDHTPSDPAKLRRQARLEETLKENLRRRKAQARARSAPDENELQTEDERSDEG